MDCCSLAVACDVGSSKAIVAVCEAKHALEPRLVPKQDGGFSSDPSVAFRNKERLFKDAVKGLSFGQQKNVVANLSEVCGLSSSELKALDVRGGSPFLWSPVHDEDDEAAPFKIKVSYDAPDGTAAGDSTFAAEQMAGMLLGALQEQAVAHLGKECPIASVSITVPDHATERQRQAWRDAAAIAQLPNASVIAASKALARQYVLTHLRPQVESGDAFEPHTTLIVDVGHASTLVCAHRFSAAGEAAIDNGNVATTELSQRATGALGARTFDWALFEHFAGLCSKDHGVEVDPASKVGMRLMRQSRKVKEILSTIPKTDLVLENITDDKDARFDIDRSTMEALCAEDITRIEKMVEDVLREAGVASAGDLTAVELVGGGCRIPAVQNAIKAAVAAAVSAEAPLSFTLDSAAAVCLGAASAGAGKEHRAAQAVKAEQEAAAAAAATAGNSESQDAGEGVTEAQDEAKEAKEDDAKGGETAAAAATNETVGLPADTVANMAAAEAAMAMQDAAVRARDEALNALQAYVYDVGALANGGFSSLVEAGAYGKFKHLIDKSKLAPLIDEAEAFIDAAGPDVTEEVFQQQLVALKAKVETDAAPAFFTAVAEDRAAKEAAMEKEAAEGEAERAAEKDADEDGMKDTRKLKKADRMRLLLKQKEEGTEVRRARETCSMEDISFFFFLLALSPLCPRLLILLSAAVSHPWPFCPPCLFAKLFKGTNYAHATARYQKALQHAAKFHDLDPEGEKEVAAIKLSLYLNVAMCNLKLERLDLCIANCDYALEVEPENVKALYRKAAAKEKKGNYDGADSDLKTAMKIAPDDSALLKLRKRVDAQIKRQKMKQKKMAQKMFG